MSAAPPVEAASGSIALPAPRTIYWPFPSWVPANLSVTWWFLFFAILLLWSEHSVLDLWSYTGADAEIFYEASADILAGRSPYRYWRDATGIERPWNHYLYPTTYAAIMMPGLWLDEFGLKKAVVILSMAAYLGMLMTLVRRALLPQRPLTAIFLLAAALMWAPAVETFRLGQSNWLTLLLLVLGWWSARRQWEFWAGVAAGLSADIKLTPLLILPVFAAAGRWRFVLGGAVGFVTPLLVLWPGYNWEYVTRVCPGMADITADATMPSLGSWLQLSGTPSIVAMGASACVLAGVCAAAFLYRKVLRPDRLYLYAIAWVPLLTAKWGHHYYIAILPVLVAFIALLKKELPWPGWLRKPLIVLLGLLMFRGVYSMHNLLPFVTHVLPGNDETLLLLTATCGILCFFLALPRSDADSLRENTPPASILWPARPAEDREPAVRL